MNQYSEYSATLSKEDFGRYQEKLTLTTGKQLKAYKSLEAYDYFVCGHLQNCYYHDIIRIKILLHQISGTCYLNIDLSFTRGNFREYETWVVWDLFSMNFLRK